MILSLWGLLVGVFPQLECWQGGLWKHFLSKSLNEQDGEAVGTKAS